MDRPQQCHLVEQPAKQTLEQKWLQLFTGMDIIFGLENLNFRIDCWDLLPQNKMKF